MEKNIVVVGSEDILNKAIIEHCENSNGNVVFFQKSNDALAYLFTKKIDLLITSIFLDGIDGVQLISAVRNSNTINSGIKTILLTSGENASHMFKKSDSPNYIINKNENALIEFKNIYEQLFELIKDQKVISCIYVEDDKFLQKMVKMWTKNEKKLDLVFCSSVKDFQERDLKGINLLVSDYTLGDGDVNDILKHRDKNNGAEIPTFIYTASIEKVNIEQLKNEFKVKEVLEKPFQLKTFLDKVDYTLSSQDYFYSELLSKV